MQALYLNLEQRLKLEAVASSTVTPSVRLSDLTDSELVGILLMNIHPGSWLQYDPDAPSHYAVWLDDEIIGTGRTVLLAIGEAEETVKGWNK